MPTEKSCSEKVKPETVRVSRASGAPLLLAPGAAGAGLHARGLGVPLEDFVLSLEGLDLGGRRQGRRGKGVASEHR